MPYYRNENLPDSWNAEGMEQKYAGLDMHAHPADGQNAETFDRELRFRTDAGLLTAFSCGTPDEWERAMRAMERSSFEFRPELRQAPGFLLSFGIHPWNTDRYNAEDYRDLYRSCDYIGEVGLDGIWCDCDPERQKEQFGIQLQIAADLGKPVILHTKDREDEAADMIRGFPENVCVHWYSGDEQNLRRLIEQDCYFTLAPDIPHFRDRVREILLREVPLNRLFVETDGLEAISWAEEKAGIQLQKKPGFEAIFDSIRATVDVLSRIRGIKPERIPQILYHNLREFLSV